MKLNTSHVNINRQKITIISFSFFFAWILSFPFEGQVLYSLAEAAGLNAIPMINMAVLAHFIGLFSSGFFIKNQPHQFHIGEA